MDAPTSTGIPTQPAPLKPWKQVAEESNIFSLPPEQRLAEYDKWSSQVVLEGIKNGDFDSPDTFSQFKLKDIRTRKNLASNDIIGPSDDDIATEYDSFTKSFQDTQRAFASNKPTPQDEAIQGEVLQGKRKSAFLRGQMFFNPAVVNDPQKYREAILESDAPSDIKMFYAGLRPEMEKSATVTRRRELANNVITRDVADRVVTAIQEGTELFAANIGAPQSPALKKNKDGVWSVVDPEYSDKETSFLGRANAKYNPLADSLYKPIAEINEYQKKYGLTDEQVQQDYMESLIENAPTSVNRWFGKATSIEDYVKQLDSTVRVKNKDVAPEVRVQDPNLFFDPEGYNAAVDKAKAPDEAKTFAKEARTQFAAAVSGDIYNNLLNNRDDFREEYAKDVVSRGDMEKAITRYYKDKKDQAWYDDVGETIGQAGTAAWQGLKDLVMMPSAIKGMFGDVEAAENYRYHMLAQQGEMQAEEAVANRTGGAGFIKLNNDVMRIIPDLVVQMGIAVATGGTLSGAQASLIAARTGISRAAATTALRQAAITGEKTALKSQLLKLIPEVTAKTVDDVAEEVLKASARTASNNPFKGGVGTQRAIGSAYAGLTSASSTFGQVYTDVRKMGKSPEESIATARTAGIVAGAITSGLTHSFGMLGKGGVEDFASMGRKAGEFTIKDIVNAGILDSLTTQEGRQLMLNIAKGISKDALSEGAEEGLDQALNLISQYATNPSPEAQNRKATDVINESLYGSLLGILAGGGAASVGQARATAPGITAQQMQQEILGTQPPVAPAVATPVPVAPNVAPAPQPVAPAPATQPQQPITPSATVSPITPEEQANYDAAKAVVIAEQNASISLLQRKLRLGYGRAQRIMDLLEQDGVIAPKSGTGSQSVLVQPQTPAVQPSVDPVVQEAKDTVESLADIPDTSQTAAALAALANAAVVPKPEFDLPEIEAVKPASEPEIQSAEEPVAAQPEPATPEVAPANADETPIEPTSEPAKVEPEPTGNMKTETKFQSIDEFLGQEGLFDLPKYAADQAKRKAERTSTDQYLVYRIDGYHVVDEPSKGDQVLALAKAPTKTKTKEIQEASNGLAPAKLPKDATKIASSPTKEGVEKQIAKFYAGEKKNLVPVGNGVFAVESQSGKRLSVRVIQTPKGFYFIEGAAEQAEAKTEVARDTTKPEQMTPEELGKFQKSETVREAQEALDRAKSGKDKPGVFTNGFKSKAEMVRAKEADLAAANAMSETPNVWQTAIDAASNQQPIFAGLVESLDDKDQILSPGPAGEPGGTVDSPRKQLIQNLTSKGYVKQGELYVYQPEQKAEVPVEEAPTKKPVKAKQPKPTKQDAVQEPSPDASVLRQKGQEVGLSEVDQGGRGAEQKAAGQEGEVIIPLTDEQASRLNKIPELEALDAQRRGLGFNYPTSRIRRLPGDPNAYVSRSDKNRIGVAAPDGSISMLSTEESALILDKINAFEKRQEDQFKQDAAQATQEFQKQEEEKFYRLSPSSPVVRRLKGKWINHFTGKPLGNSKNDQRLLSELNDNPNIESYRVVAKQIGDGVAWVSPEKAGQEPEAKPELTPEQNDVVVFVDIENDTQEKAVVAAEKKPRMTPGKARKVGIAKQIDRLGITSNDPDSVIAALEKIANNPKPKPSEKHHIRIAKDLLSVLKDSGVQIQLVSGNDARMAKHDSRVNGWYDPAKNTAYINLDGPHELGIEETILHELVHASGEKVIQNPQTEQQKSILADLEKQMLAARKNAIALGQAKLGTDVTELGLLTEMAAAQNDYGLFDILYGVSSLSEYHAHATTSRSFQKFLATYKEGVKRSLMERFINGITSLLSGKKTAEGSDAEKAYATLLDLMREGKGDVRLSNADVVQSRARGASTEQDAKYLELAKDPEKNAEALQAMVDAVAKAAGFDIGPVSHATDAKFNEFNPTLRGRFGRGMYFSDKYLSYRGKINMRVYLKNPQATEIKSPWKRDSPKWTPETHNEYFVTDPSQIKSADPVTYDNDGNIIPLSQRFQSTSPDIRFSRARGTGEDTIFVELERRFKAGDKDAEGEARKLIEKMAKEQGWTEKAYHGTPGGGFTVFDIYGSRYGLMGQGTYFTNAKDVAQSYAENKGRKVDSDSQTPQVYEVFLKPGRVLDMEAPVDKQFWLDAFGEYLTEDSLSAAKTNEDAFRAMEEAIADEGVSMSEGSEIVTDGLMSRFDSVTHIGGKRMGKGENLHNVTIVFNSEQIKSADPFTYDDAGNLILPSERFQPESPDIRFSKARSIISDTVTKFAPEFNVIDDKDGPAVFFDGRNVTVNPDALENLDEYEVKNLSERAVVAAKAAPKDPIAASIIQQMDGYSTYNFDSVTRKEIRKSLAKAHAVATENGMAPLAMDLGAKLFEYGGATDAEVRKLMAKDASFGERATYTAEPDTKRYSLPRGGELVGPATFSIKAFHGTPKKVDSFSMNYVGAGEGTQFEGYGLYFAGQQKIGEWYRDNVASNNGELLRSALDFISQKTGGDPTEDYGYSNDGDYITLAESLGWKPPEGNLYTVELYVEEGDFLDWDKPLGEQSEKVKRYINQQFNGLELADDFWGQTGEDFMQSMRDERGDKEASKSLLLYGIKGVRYLDGMSRKAGEGSFNYVIFDDKLIKILEENGTPVPQSRARGTEGVVYVPTKRSAPRLAVEKFFAGFRSRGMVTEDTYEIFRNSDAYKREIASFISFIGKDFSNVANKHFGEGEENWLSYRIFSRDSTGEVTVSKTGFKTAKEAEGFAQLNRIKDYTVATGEDLMNRALGSNEPTLSENVREKIEQLTKKGLYDIAKSIAAYKEEYLDYWNLVMLETQADMVDAKQIATLRERKQQWMKALQLRAAEQRQIVDDARKEAVRVALEEGTNRIIAQQQFAKSYLPDDLVHQIERSRAKIDELSGRLTKIEWLMDGSQLQMIIDAKTGVYVTRSYEAFETNDRVGYVNWLDEAYRALYDPKQDYDPLAKERIMPLVRHLKNNIIERRIEDLKLENEQRQVDEIMADLMTDPRQVTQVDMVPGQSTEGTEYEELVRAVAKRELLRRRSEEKRDFIRRAMRSLALNGFASNIRNARKRLPVLRKEANRLYDQRYPEQVAVAGIMGAPNALRYTLMTDDEAHDIANTERAISETHGSINGSEIWTASISGEKHSSFYAAVNDDFRQNLDFITGAPSSKTGFSGATANDWKRLGDKILEHKNDVPAFLRTFLGERDNPLLRVSDTLLKQSHLIAVGELYQNLAKTGMAQGWIVDRGTLSLDGKKYAGWKTILDSEKTNQGYENNPFSGKYIDPVMADAINVMLAANQPSNTAFKAVAKIVGFALWGVTAGSVKAIIRNLLSAPSFLLNSGFLVTILDPRRLRSTAQNVALASIVMQESMSSVAKVSGGKKIEGKAFKLADKAWTGLLTIAASQRTATGVMKGVGTVGEFISQMKSKPTSEAAQRFYSLAVRLGVANDNVQKEAMERLLSLEETISRQPKDKNLGRFAKALKLDGVVGFGSYLLGTIRSAGQQRSQLYGAPDDFTKILAWLNEMDSQARIRAKDTAQYNEWKGADGLFTNMPENLVKLAADHTTDTIQSHSKVWAHITQFKKAGFGVLLAPFVAARAEFYRNAINAYRIGFQELRSENGKERSYGAARIASAVLAHTAYANMAGAALSMIFKAMADDDDVAEDSPEKREAIRKLGPEYAKNKNATYVVYKNGTFDWLDISFSDPFSFVSSSLNAARRGIDEKAVDDHVAWSVAKELMAENFGTFVSPQIAVGATATMISGYDPVRGIKIWDSQADTTAEKVQKAIAYYAKQAGTPGDIKSAMNIIKAARGIEENGRQYKLGTEIGGVFLGASVRTIKVTDMVEQKLAQAKDNLNTRVGALYEAQLRDSNDVDMDDVVAATETYHRVGQDAIRRMQKVWKAGETLLSDTPGGQKMLNAVMESDKVKMNAVTERAIKTGKNVPSTLSPQTEQKVGDLGNKHGDDRLPVTKDTLKRLNQKP